MFSKSAKRSKHATKITKKKKCILDPFSFFCFLGGIGLVLSRFVLVCYYYLALYLRLVVAFGASDDVKKCANVAE